MIKKFLYAWRYNKDWCAECWGMRRYSFTYLRHCIETVRLEREFEKIGVRSIIHLDTLSPRSESDVPTHVYRVELECGCTAGFKVGIGIGTSDQSCCADHYGQIGMNVSHKKMKDALP